MDCSTPGFPIHHQLLELAQTHVHRVGDAFQPSQTLSSPSPDFNLSEHQGHCQEPYKSDLPLKDYLRGCMDFPDGSDGKESVCNVGDPGLIPGLGRAPGEGNGNLLQYSCMENSMDRQAWQAIVHEVVKTWTQLSD